MTKPKPPQSPQPTWTPSQVQSQSSNESQFPPPRGARLDIGDVSPFVDPLDPPVYGSVSKDDEMLCDSCSNCWKMDLAGQFKNKRPDGSDFILTERFCVFKDSLVSLSERVVKSCSRYKKKEN
jgi:hypothetical protein